ncbi:MAG: histidine kinase N-terminal 7TM domain-containing protein [Halorientalis sp.]
MFQPTPYALPLAVVTLLAVGGGYLTWRRGDSAAERWFVAVELAVAVWAAVHLLAISLRALPAKEVVYTLGFPLLLLLPVSLLGFTLHYTGRSHLVTRRRVAGVLLLPVVTAAGAITNDWHGLYYTGLREVDAGAYVLATFDWGPLTVASILLSWLAIAVCIGLLVGKFRRSRNVYRKLSFILLVTFTVMWLSNVASFLGYSPFPHFTLLPLTFLVFGTVAIATIQSTRFVRMLPLERVLSSIGGHFDDVVMTARDAIVEEIDNGVVVLDADGAIVDINSTAKEMLGVDRPVGQRISTVVDFDAITKGGTVTMALRDDLQVDDLRDQLWVETPVGERCYDVNVSALGDGDDVVGRVVLIHDITEQKRREEKLRERERTLQEKTRDLEQRTQQLEHQNERLDRFASIVSHDLRNPLNVASMRADLLADRLEDTDDVEEILAAHERMEDIIDDALTLARQGRAVTETSRVSLARIARDAWENVETQGATLHVDTDASVDADYGRLLTVFENLFRNAVEHGGPDVAVRVVETAGGFAVVDDGPGIPSSERGDVFEQGYSTSEHGTGLGLAIVEDVVRGHGWSVSVAESAEGGTRFEFETGESSPPAGSGG